MPPYLKRQTLEKSLVFLFVFSVHVNIKLKTYHFVSLLVWDCGSPPQLSHATVKYSSTSYRDVATYTCEEGYKLSNSTKTLKATCNEHGNWTFSSNASCQSRCHTANYHTRKYRNT